MNKPLLSLLLVLSLAFKVDGQEFIAPEGKIINDRTLVWSDFHGKPQKNEEDNVAAATQPAIYVIFNNPEEHPNKRITFNFKVKCAFQSASWVRERIANSNQYSEYVLNHEQDHYDIALHYALKLQSDLSSHDYDIEKYDEEIDTIYHRLYRSYNKTQNDYDEEADHGLIKENQALWDMRIKKCLQNRTNDYFNSPLKDVKDVTYLIQKVTRIPGEPARQFAVRCRPLYSEYNDTLNALLQEFKNWTPGSSAIMAFYQQNYTYNDIDNNEQKSKRILGYTFLPQANNVYKRTLIDTFDGSQGNVTIKAAFFANADSDETKELIVITCTTVNSASMKGKLYTTFVYDNTKPNVYPARLAKLTEISNHLSGGLEGTSNGKPSKATIKSQAEVIDALRKKGIINN